MLLSDLKNKTILRSGQFIVGDLAAMNLTLDEFWSAIEVDIYFYERFFPQTKHFNIFAPASFSYDFTTDPNNAGFVAPTDPPVIIPQGTEGNSIWSYYIAAYDNVGQLLSVTNAGMTALGNATLTTGNYNLVTWLPITRAATYSIWRLSASQTQLNGMISSGVTTTSLNDTGLTGDGSPVPAVNGVPPERVTSLIPVGTMQVISVLAYWMSPLTRDIYSPNRIVEPRTFLHRYDKPCLRYSESGVFDVKCNYPYTLFKQYDDQRHLVDIEIEGITEDSIYYLMELLVGRFLTIVGRARRAFTYNELPITSDSASLVSEGLAQIDAAKKEIYQRARWDQALRP